MSLLHNSLSHEHVLELHVEHLLHVKGSKPGKIAKRESNRLAGTGKRHPHIIKLVIEIAHIAGHVLACHRGESEHKFANILTEFLVADKELEASTGTAERKHDNVGK